MELSLKIIGGAGNIVIAYSRPLYPEAYIFV